MTGSDQPAGDPLRGGRDGVVAPTPTWVELPVEPGRDVDHEPVRRIDRRVLTGLAVAVVGWLGFIVAGQLFAGDETAAERAREALAPEPTGVPTAEPTPTATAVPVEPTAEVAVVSDDAMAPSVQDGIRRVAAASAGQADRLQRQIVRRGLDLSVAYRTATGVAVFDLDQADVVELLLSATAPNLGSYDESQLLRSGNEVLSVARDRSWASMIRADGSLIVTDVPEGGVWSVDADLLGGQAAEVTHHTLGGETSMSSPHAHQLEVVDGLGLVAWGKGPDGGSQVARPAGFEALGDHRLVSVAADVLVEQVCDGGSCELWVSSLSDGFEPWFVPEGFVAIGDRLIPSPDGRSLLRVDRTGLAEVYSSLDDSVSWVIGRGMQNPVWSPDSSTLLWIDLIGQPELKSMFLDERLWISVDLRTSGAPRPVTTGLAVFDASSRGERTG